MHFCTRREGCCQPKPLCLCPRGGMEPIFAAGGRGIVIRNWCVYVRGGMEPIFAAGGRGVAIRNLCVCVPEVEWNPFFRPRDGGVRNLCVFVPGVEWNPFLQ